MKTVLFVPGFKEDLSSRDYSSVLAAIESRGYIVRFISINWKRTTIHDWVSQLTVVYNEYDPANVVLAGFSFGSMTAFMVATETNPSELWLFSFSPYFAEDIPSLKSSWLSYVGKDRTAAFSRLDFTSLASRIHCPTLVMVGKIEAKRSPQIGRRAKTAHELITNSRLVEVLGVSHDVADRRYIEAIKKAI